MQQYSFVLVSLPEGRDVPAVIISPDKMNGELSSIIIAPIIKHLRPYPTRVPIKVGNQRGQVILDQVRTIEKSRVKGQHGFLTKREIEEVKVAIQIVFDF